MQSQHKEVLLDADWAQHAQPSADPALAHLQKHHAGDDGGAQDDGSAPRKAVLLENVELNLKGAGSDDDSGAAAAQEVAVVAPAADKRRRGSVVLNDLKIDWTNPESLATVVEAERHALTVDFEDSDADYTADQFHQRLLDFRAELPSSLGFFDCKCTDGCQAETADADGSSVPKFTIFGRTYTRQQALIEMMRRHRQFKRVSEQEDMFWTHVTVQLIAEAQDRRSDEDRSIQQMLIMAGYTSVDLKFILQLPADSPDRQLLSQKLQSVRAAEAERQAAAEQRRLADLAAARRREEELAERMEREREDEFTRARRAREEAELIAQQEVPPQYSSSSLFCLPQPSLIHPVCFRQS
jgi:hypothetical protein